MNACIVCQLEIQRGRKLCNSPLCKSEHSRRTIQRSFLSHGGEITKFRKTNGMHQKETRELVSRRLKEIGHCPIERGGNGRGPTLPERMLSNALGWKTNIIVNTHGGRAFGYPTHYKIDVGNESKKIGIEIDGSSHTSLERKSQDIKKTEWLTRNGWKILRFTNQQVISDLEGCVSAVRGSA